MQQRINEEYLSNPVDYSGNIEWLPDLIEFDYGTFIISFDGELWVASHWDEDRFPEDIILCVEGKEEFEDIDIFGEKLLTKDEFKLIRESITNILK